MVLIFDIFSFLTKIGVVEKKEVHGRRLDDVHGHLKKSRLDVVQTSSRRRAMVVALARTASRTKKYNL